MYEWLADLVVAVHAAYVGFVVFGVLAVPLGAALGWRWVRNPVFRVVHLVMIGIVAAEAVCGVDCPLTIWEGQLRSAAGQDVSQASFIGRLLHGLIFYQLPEWVFTTIYVTLAVAIALSLWLIPPRWRRRIERPSH